MQRATARLRNALFSGSNGIRENSSLVTHTSEKGVGTIVEDERELVTGIHYINANDNGSFEEEKVIVFDPKKVFTEPLIDRFGTIKGVHYPGDSADQDVAKSFVKADIFFPISVTTEMRSRRTGRSKESRFPHRGSEWIRGTRLRVPTRPKPTSSMCTQILKDSRYNY
jgi:hypothetical protein